jgi:hypothetical protein
MDIEETGRNYVIKTSDIDDILIITSLPAAKHISQEELH